MSELSPSGSGLPSAARGRIAILGAASGLGGARPGVARAPDAIRRAGLARMLEGLGYVVEDAGDVPAPAAPAAPAGAGGPLNNLAGVVAVCEAVAGRVAALRRAGARPLVLGGDHSVTLGVLAGLRAAEAGPVGLVYFDAHGDYNTDRTTPSRNIHGMVLAACAGLGHPALVSCGGAPPKVAEEHIVLIGARDLDPLERETLRRARLRAFTMEDVDLLGMREVIQQTLERLAPCGGRVHVSLDLDVLDPREAPGLAVPVRGGLSYRELHLALELLSQAGLPFSADVVELDPERDPAGETAGLAVEFVGSLFGKRILG